MNRRRVFIRPEDFLPDPGPCPRLTGETYEERHGITRSEVKAIERKYGVDKLVQAYELQRRAAWARGIVWEFNFRQWLEVWGAEIARRGQGKDKLMMCRKDGRGSYSADNVYLGTPHENSSDRWEARRVARSSKYRHQTGNLHGRFGGY